MTHSDDIARAAARFVVHLPKGGDFTLLVLKGHLLVEELLRDITNRRAAPSEKPKIAKMRFWALTRVVRALTGDEFSDAFWQAINELNTLRNQMAHHLQPNDTEVLAKQIIAQVARYDPVAMIEMASALDAESDTTPQRLRLAIGCLCGSLVSALQ